MKSWTWAGACVLLAVCMMSASALAQEKQAVLSTVNVDVYGYVKMDASYDSRRTTAGDLMFFVLPDGPDGRKEEFNMTARESRLGVNLSVPGLENTRVRGKFETDFYGKGGDIHSPNVRMRLAYVDIQHDALTLLAGQDWDTFITLGPGYAVFPRMVNFSCMAHVGALGLRRPQVRVTRDVKVGDSRVIWKLAAARMIGEDVDGDGQDDGAASGLPVGQVNLILVSQPFGERKTVLSVGGHAGVERARAYAVQGSGEGDPVVMPKKDYETWSLIGGVSQQLSGKLTLQGLAWAGENLDAYFGGIGQGINRTLGVNVAAQGGWAQLMLDATDALNVNIGYGLDNPDSADLNAGGREKNALIFASVFYKVNSATTLALEYSNMTTSYKGGDDAENHRVQGSVMFRF